MPYVIRKGKLEFRPGTGNGPCNRRHVGDVDRRILSDRTGPVGRHGSIETRVHATKGVRRKTIGIGASPLIYVPPQQVPPPERQRPVDLKLRRYRVGPGTPTGRPSVSALTARFVAPKDGKRPASSYRGARRNAARQRHAEGEG